MKLPQYVRKQGNSLGFQRDYPKAVRAIYPKKTFTYPLGLRPNEATATNIARAVANANEQFELKVKMILNSDPDAFDASELDKATIAYLRAKRLRKGQHTKVYKDPSISELEERNQQQLQPHESDYSDMAIPEFEDILDKYKRKEHLTFQDRVVANAWQSLHAKARQQPKTLSSLWDAYAEYREFDEQTGDRSKTEKRWQRWLAIVGDTIISTQTLDHIHDGLDQYVAERHAEGIKGTSIRRELNDVVACLRYASRKLRLRWVIEMPEIPKSAPKQRIVISVQEQRDLVNYCLNANAREAPLAACLLLMLQGAMMASEIKRLKPEQLGLHEDIPIIIVAGTTKTIARKRIIPVVLGSQFIAKHMNEAIEWLNKTTGANHSKRLAEIVQKATRNPNVTSHCLRHTFKANCQVNNVSTLLTASIAGWSGASVGFSDNMLNYGTDGLSHSGVIASLWEASQQIHQHLLIQQSTKIDNVVPFSKLK